MQQFHAQRKKEPFLGSVGRCTISCILGLLTQYALSLVPRFFSASFLLIQLALSGSPNSSLWNFSMIICFENFIKVWFYYAVVVLLLVVGFGKWCRKLLGVSASAPAFVFFNILFVWVVYFVIVRQGGLYFHG